MKKAPKISDQRLADLIKTPSFWESLRFTQGSYSKAGKKLKIAPAVLRKLGKERTAFERKEHPITVSDSTFAKLKKAVRRMDKRDYDVARQYAFTPREPLGLTAKKGRGAAGQLTPGQVEYAKRYTSRGPKQAEYFRKAVRDYYLGKTKTVRMGAITESGKVYNPGASKYRKTKTLVRKQRKEAKRAFRRSGRRGNR